MSVYTDAAGNIDSIENDRLLSDWRVGLSWQEAMALYRNNKELLLDKLGRQSCTFTGEYRHWVWEITFEGYRCFVLSGKRGTSYEVPVEMPGPIRIQFVEFMLDLYN